MSKSNLSKVVLLMALVLAVLYPSSAAHATDFSKLNIAANSFVPEDETRYTVTFSTPQDLAMSVNKSIYLDLPVGYQLINNSSQDANPGISLSSLQYKKVGDKYYSILGGSTRVIQEVYKTRLQYTPITSDTIPAGTDIHLLVPGVINPPGQAEATLQLSIETLDGAGYTGNCNILFGAAPTETPQFLSVKATKSLSIEASWAPVENATRYQLYYSLNRDGHYIQACDFGYEPLPGQVWSLTNTACQFSANGNGGLQPGRTYYFQVRAGNEFGFGAYSPIAEVTTPQVQVSTANIAHNITGIDPATKLDLTFSQPIKVLDADKVQVFEKSTGTPIPVTISVYQNKLTLAATFNYATTYQLVFYDQALENAETPGVYNPLSIWNFSTKNRPSSSSSSSDNSTSTPTTPNPLPLPETSQPKHSFVDLDNHWAKNVIEDFSQLNYIQGVDNLHFAPDRPITRAEFVTLVTRIFPMNKRAPIPFSDVPTNAWYYDSLSQAYGAGLIQGRDTTHFAPNQYITREEMAVIVGKLLVHEQKISTANTSILEQFSDASKISSWSKSACALLVDQGILQGDNRQLSPTKNTTRAETVVVMNKLLKLINNQGGATTV